MWAAIDHEAWLLVRSPASAVHLECVQSCRCKACHGRPMRWAIAHRAAAMALDTGAPSRQPVMPPMRSELGLQGAPVIVYLHAAGKSKRPSASRAGQHAYTSCHCCEPPPGQSAAVAPLHGTAQPHPSWPRANAQVGSLSARAGGAFITGGRADHHGAAATPSSSSRAALTAEAAGSIAAAMARHRATQTAAANRLIGAALGSSPAAVWAPPAPAPCSAPLANATSTGAPSGRAVWGGADLHDPADPARAGRTDGAHAVGTQPGGAHHATGGTRSPAHSVDDMDVDVGPAGAAALPVALSDPSAHMDGPPHKRMRKLPVARRAQGSAAYGSDGEQSRGSRRPVEQAGCAVVLPPRQG